MDGPIGMDVHLLVYDLTNGMAKDLSLSVLGFQLDAVYHTSIELFGREYVYDGGILDINPGSSHLGRPMQRLRLGRTMLPMEVIREYLTSVRSIHTAEVQSIVQETSTRRVNSSPEIRSVQSQL